MRLRFGNASITFGVTQSARISKTCLKCCDVCRVSRAVAGKIRECPSNREYPSSVQFWRRVFLNFFMRLEQTGYPESEQKQWEFRVPPCGAHELKCTPQIENACLEQIRHSKRLEAFAVSNKKGSCRHYLFEIRS